MDRIAAIREIREIEKKIQRYNTAKQSMTTIKNDCRGKSQTWQSSYQAWSGNPDLSQIKKTGVFEGEMADELATKIADVLSQISNGVTQSNGLEGAISSQITYIDGKIRILRNKITALYKFVV